MNQLVVEFKQGKILIENQSKSNLQRYAQKLANVLNGTIRKLVPGEDFDDAINIE